MADKVYMLTTIDNPFNPFTNFDEWFAFDVDQGYNTCALLARETFVSDELSDSQIESFKQMAIDTVVDNDLTNKYIRCHKDSRILTPQI